MPKPNIQKSDPSQHEGPTGSNQPPVTIIPTKVKLGAGAHGTAWDRGADHRTRVGRFAEASAVSGRPPPGSGRPGSAAIALASCELELRCRARLRGICPAGMGGRAFFITRAGKPGRLGSARSRHHPIWGEGPAPIWGEGPAPDRPKTNAEGVEWPFALDGKSSSVTETGTSCPNRMESNEEVAHPARRPISRARDQQRRVRS